MDRHLLKSFSKYINVGSTIQTIFRFCIFLTFQQQQKKNKVTQSPFIIFYLSCKNRLSAHHICSVWFITPSQGVLQFQYYIDPITEEQCLCVPPINIRRDFTRLSLTLHSAVICRLSEEVLTVAVTFFSFMRTE